MANEVSNLRIEILPPPKELQRRPGKSQFAPPPTRDRADQAELVRGGIQTIQSVVAALTPEQKRAVYVKLESGPGHALQESDLQKVGLIPIRQNGRQVTVALATDTNLTAFEQRVDQYETSVVPTGKYPRHATLIANLEQAPAILPIEDRTSDSFQSERAGLVKKTWANVKLEISPLSPKDESPQALKKALDEAFSKLTKAFGQGVQGQVFDHIYDGSDRTITLNVRIQGKLLDTMLKSSDWSFITWFDTLPRFKTLSEELRDFEIKGKTILAPPQQAPIICVIDTGLLAANALLKPAIAPRMEKSFNSNAPNSTTDGVNHGTGVAGLAIYHDLSGKLAATTFSPTAWIANARILDDTDSLGEGQLFAKVLEDAIRHFHKLGCRIFNLSVCDRDKPYHPRNPLDVAEMVDTLASELDVLIIVSTGNLLLDDINHHHTNGTKYPDFLRLPASRILDPAQAVNAITVGSVAGSHKIVGQNHRPFVLAGQPSPFTRSGPGINDYIKPDLVEDGGNLAHDPRLNRIVPNMGCEIITASNDLGKLLHRTRGTSYSAPRVAHLAAKVMEYLQGIKSLDGRTIKPSANLMRALLVNSATPDEESLKLFEKHPGKAKFDWLPLCGYGQPKLDLAIGVRRNRAILIYQGEVGINKIVYFEIPVPEVLKQAGRSFDKRIRVTVAYDPPVRRTRTFQYCGTRMSWKLFRGDIVPNDIVTAMSIDEATAGFAGDVPNELPGLLSSQRRSRSTVQHDIFTWKIHKDSYSKNPYTLAVIAQRNWDTSAVTQRFAVAVTVEVDDPQLDIATVISQRVRQPIRVRVK